MKERYEFFDTILERLEHAHDVTMMEDFNGILAVINNIHGNCSSLIQLNECTGKITEMVVDNNIYEILQRNTGKYIKEKF